MKSVPKNEEIKSNTDENMSMFSSRERPDGNKEDETVLSKRKKQIENMKISPRKKSKRPKYEWTQSSDDVKVMVRVDTIHNDMDKHIDVQFADTDVYVKLPDGRNWTWVLSNEILKESSRVKIKKQKLTLYMKKKKPKMWEYFEAEKTACPPTVDTMQTDVSTVNEMPADNVEKISSSSSHFDEDNSKVPVASYACMDLLVGAEDMPSELQEIQEDVQAAMESIDVFEEVPLLEDLESVQKNCKKEESVMELNHIKHDFIEKGDIFVVHIYVKCVNKDDVSINIEANRFMVMFQTSNSDFLKMYQGSSPDTKFVWQVQLRGEIVPEKCAFKISQSCLELMLRKKKIDKWGNLEAFQKKASSLCTSQEAMLDNMKKDIERDNLNEYFQESVLSSVLTVNDASKKPTCKVLPLNKQVEVGVQLVTPGYTGLENLGNTCFMNGILQCLVNTREFRDFFLNGDFQKDLNESNALGSGGKMALAFDILCRVLWSGKYVSYQPSKLKLMKSGEQSLSLAYFLGRLNGIYICAPDEFINSLVAQKASQFTGFAQHDAQEFLAFLLDGLHEDLNRVKNKPYIQTVDDGGRPDEVVANEAWAMYKKRNDSFIVDLFHGQYKSKLVCPVCGKVSITFDPFLYLSLPLPKKQRLLPVTFLWRCPYRKPVRYMLWLSVEATVENLKENLQKKTEVAANNMRVFEAYKGKIRKMFKKGASLSSVQYNQVVIVCEVMSEQDAGETVYEVAVVQRTLIPNEFPSRCSSCQKLCPEDSKLKRCTKCLKVGYCDQTCQKNHWSLHRSLCNNNPEPVGTPFIICVPKSRATFSNLCTLLAAYARYSVDVFQPPVKNEPAPQLNSHPSCSNLSNSSQSSGSQNNLNSRSSCCSSCTITADQEQELADLAAALPNSNIQKTSKGDTVMLPVDSDFPCPSIVSLQSGSKEPLLDMETVPHLTLTQAELNVEGNVAQKMESASGNFPRIDSEFFQVCSNAENIGFSSPTETGKCSNSSLPENILEKDTNASAMKSVLGIQSGNKEKTNPMFVIQPVDAEGAKDGDYLTDAGDVLLDLSRYYCLSIDWRNNDKYKGYVLVQSKELEYDSDISVRTASLEESSTVTLEQCLELFTDPEVLTPDEAWYCPQCKEHREATKQLSTWRLPHTLIIQLKRFSFRNFIWRDKIDKMVEFPTRGLDMSAYYVGSRPTDEPPPVYDLYGVVNHCGGILGGHYTAYVRCVDKNHPFQNEVGWRLCDDNYVTSVGHEKNVVSRAAYLLFYRRRELFIAPPTSVLSTTACTTSDEEAEFHSADSDFERTSSQCNDEVFENDGRLLIDTYSSSSCGDELELPDLEDFVSRESMVDVQDGDGTPPIMVLDDLDLITDLGYTDMDSVD